MSGIHGMRMLKKLVKALAGIRRRKHRQPGTNALSGMFSGMLAATADQEIGCDEAFQLLDQYAEIIARGDDPAVLLPVVRHHLSMCRDCREELEALLRALEAGRN